MLLFKNGIKKKDFVSKNGVIFLCALLILCGIPEKLKGQGVLVLPVPMSARGNGPAHEVKNFPYKENYLMLPVTSGAVGYDGTGRRVVVNKPIPVSPKRQTVIPLDNLTTQVSPAPVVPRSFNTRYAVPSSQMEVHTGYPVYRTVPSAECRRPVTQTYAPTQERVSGTKTYIGSPTPAKKNELYSPEAEKTQPLAVPREVYSSEDVSRSQKYPLSPPGMMDEKAKIQDLQKTAPTYTILVPDKSMKPIKSQQKEEPYLSEERKEDPYAQGMPEEKNNDFTKVYSLSGMPEKPEKSDVKENSADSEISVDSVIMSNSGSGVSSEFIVETEGKEESVLPSSENDIYGQKTDLRKSHTLPMKEIYSETPQEMKRSEQEISSPERFAPAEKMQPKRNAWEPYGEQQPVRLKHISEAPDSVRDAVSHVSEPENSVNFPVKTRKERSNLSAYPMSLPPIQATKKINSEEKTKTRLGPRI
ncbi:MAG: hypothetical protein Q4C96_01200 [Planctomycetia bacterium]|nr:hypothetical protein [Planctomycetia bacterium]